MNVPVVVVVVVLELLHSAEVPGVGGRDEQALPVARDGLVLGTQLLVSDAVDPSPTDKSLLCGPARGRADGGVSGPRTSGGFPVFRRRRGGEEVCACSTVGAARGSRSKICRPPSAARPPCPCTSRRGS